MKICLGKLDWVGSRADWRTQEKIPVVYEEYAPYWASFFFLTRQGDFIGFSAAEGVCFLPREGSAGSCLARELATSRVPESQQPLPMWDLLGSCKRPRVKMWSALHFSL